MINFEVGKLYISVHSSLWPLVASIIIYRSDRDLSGLYLASSKPPSGLQNDSANRILRYESLEVSRIDISGMTILSSPSILPLPPEEDMIQEFMLLRLNGLKNWYLYRSPNDTRSG